MFEDTRPADLDATGNADTWAAFRVAAAGERLRVLRELRDGSQPVSLSGGDGVTVTTTLWVIDAALQRLSFNVAADAPTLARLVDRDEAVAVAYLDSVKLQFELHGLVLVRGSSGAALQCAMPAEIYRFQRRNAFRVRPAERNAPVARLRHPSMPEMTLVLRIVDISIGGCALWLPANVPPVQAGTRLGELLLELDAHTAFTAAVTIQHVSSPSRDAGVPGTPPGMRLGCEWQPLGGMAERALQRWIDQAQRRHRLHALL